MVISGTEIVPSCDPRPEICDGIDQNCDGVADDNILPLNCTVSGDTTCVCNFTAPACVAGVPQTCPARSVGAETCNNVDDDCDGSTDEAPLVGFGGACGTCGRGTLACQGGMAVCNGDVAPTTEICNGLDDDCNGMVDEAPLPGIGSSVTCGSNVGVCRFGSMACVAGRPVCQGGVMPGTETCNGLDDDCDGATDEDLTPPAIQCDRFRPPGATMPVGVCAGSMMSVVCSGTSGWRCTMPANYRDLADEAFCDGLDNNCDGRVDEGCLRVGPTSDIWVERDNAWNATTPVIHGNGTAVGIAYAARPIAGGAVDTFFHRSIDVTSFWNTWEPRRQVDTSNGSNDDSYQPDMMFAGNNLVVGFTAGSTGNTRIRGRRSSNAGSSFLTASDEPVSNNMNPTYITRIGVWPDNRAIAVFEVLLSTSSAGVDRHIYATNHPNVTNPSLGWSPSSPVRVDRLTSVPPQVANSVDLALGPPGVAHVVFRDTRDGYANIRYQRTDNYGLTWLANNVRINQQATMTELPHDAIAPSIAVSGNTVYVAWSEVRYNPMATVPDRYDIYFNSSTDGGMSWRPAAVRVDTDPLPHESLRPSMVALTNTVGVVVWEDWRSGRPSVRANRTTDAGATWMTNDIPAQGGAGSSCCPLVAGRPGTSTAVDVVAAGSNNTVFVVWADDRDEPGNPMMGVREHYNIYANYSLDGGLTFQPYDLRLDTSALGTDQEQPAVFSLNGVGHFTWVDRRNTSSTGVTNLQGDIFYRNLHF
jgi:hypothetical protein